MKLPCSLKHGYFRIPKSPAAAPGYNIYMMTYRIFERQEPRHTYCILIEYIFSHLKLQCVVILQLFSVEFYQSLLYRKTEKDRVQYPTFFLHQYIEYNGPRERLCFAVAVITCFLLFL